MSQSDENIPLLDSTNQQNPNIFPSLNKNLSNNYDHPISNYGVMESSVQSGSGRRQPTQWPGLVKFPFSPLVTLVVVVVGFVLIFTLAITFTPMTDSDTQQGGPNSKSGTNLKSAAPSSTSSYSSHSRSRLSQSSPTRSHVDIQIPQGRLRGYKKLSRDGREYSAFYKVPYAAPPVGSLRFKDPSPPSSWTGLRDNPVVAPQCLQKEKYAETPTAGGEEDCLYANIYTPRLPPNHPGDEVSSDLMPVMVYIHGGGFSSGNGSRYGVDYFMDEDVILLTFQWRLGPFGFLSTGDDVIRGNMGLKDQVQMLKWVKDNIKYFNGNPDLVSIFGNSGGGTSIGYLLLSPMTNGLFHRAISQSGTSITEYGPNKVNASVRKTTMEEIGKAVGCPTEDSQKYKDCLLEKDAKELVLVQEVGVVYDFVVENRLEGDESTKLMPDEPFKLLQSGKIHPVPYIVGNNNAEYHGNAGSLLRNTNLTQMLNERFEEVAPSLLNLPLTSDELSKLKEFYFQGNPIGNATFESLGDLISDAQIIHSSYMVARYHAKQGKAYLYLMSKPPYKSYMEKFVPGIPVKELGWVSHADELQYLFLYDGYPAIPKDDPEYYKFSKYFVKLWANFARIGNPSMDGIEWSPVNAFGDGYANSTYWLELNDNPALTSELQERMGLWDKFALKDLNYEW